MPFHRHIVIYNHCTCVDFLRVIHALVYIWKDTYLLMGHKLLVIDDNYQNTELREWIAYHVMIVWLLVC